MSELWAELLRPFIAALLIPPAPFLILIGLALCIARSRRKLSFALIGASTASLWLCSTVGFAQFLVPLLLRPPPQISEVRIQQLAANPATRAHTAIIALGSGIVQHAPEYASADLTSVDRLRYAVWLSRRTNIPAGFAGGIGWAGEPGQSEGVTAQRIAATEFNHPLQWVEGQSRDTLENASLSLPLLAKDGVRHVILVTSASHMQRALRAFERSAKQSGITVEPAPMNLAIRVDQTLYNWVPTPYGAGLVPTIFREWIGFLAGA